jgi:hypothetical protein
METFNQFVKREVDELMQEYGCSVEDAYDTANSHYSEWVTACKEHLQAGAIPSQWWINTVIDRDDQGHIRYGWWASFLKHNPVIFDRLTAAGRSVYMTRRELHAPAEA